MKMIGYRYSEPLLELTSIPQEKEWGITVYKNYQDFGERHQFNQLLTDCQSEPVDYLIVHQLTDLGTNILEICQRLIQLETLGISLIIQPKNQEINFTPTPQKDLIKLLAEIPHDHLSQKIRQGHARNRLATLPPPGKAPYGYKRGKDRYILDRSAVPVVKDFFEHFLIYGSLRGSVRHLAKKYGKKISVSTGRRWLTNPVYRGDLLYQNTQIISNTHPPIISREESAQIDRLLKRNRRLPPRTASVPRSLGGLVFCENCQSPLGISRVTSFRKEKEYLYLRPLHCSQNPSCKSLAYEEVLHATIQGICQDFYPAVAGLEIPDMEAIKRTIQTKINTKKAILSQIPKGIESGIFDQETAQLRQYKLRTEIAELETQLDQFPPVNLRGIAQVVSLPQFWLDLSESERRFYFREFIKQIKIIRESETWKLKVIFVFTENDLTVDTI